MTNIKKILITISIFLLSFGQIANAGWEPSQEVEIVAHAKETSSTVAFARAVIKVIEEENLLPNGEINHYKRCKRWKSQKLCFK